MPIPTTSRVRFALVAVAAVLTLGFLVPGAWSQVGRPPGFPPLPGAGLPVRPPGFPALPAVPALPAMPAIPTPPRTPTLLPGVGGGRTERVWSCSGCNRELGRGLAPPAVHTCPGCGARLVGIEFAPPGGGGRPAGTGLPGGVTVPDLTGTPFAPAPVVPPGGFELPTNPAARDETTPKPEPATPAAAPPPAVSAAPPAPSESSTATSRSGRSGTVLKFIGILVGVGLVLVVGGMLFAVAKNAGGNRPVKRFRPGRDD